MTFDNLVLMVRARAEALGSALAFRFLEGEDSWNEVSFGNLWRKVERFDAKRILAGRSLVENALTVTALTRVGLDGLLSDQAAALLDRALDQATCGPPPPVPTMQET